MSRIILWIIALYSISGSGLPAASLMTHPAAGERGTTLRIYGAADHPVITPLIEAFQRVYPSVEVLYWEYGTRSLFDAIQARPSNMPDLVLSSSMHLQIKLVNDNYAQRYDSERLEMIPDWAQWRNEVVGYAQEAAVIAYDANFFKETPIPQSRIDLLEYIRDNSKLMMGRIGTFDIAKVGLGYLVWLHNRRFSDSNGRLLESFAAHKVKLYPTSSSMLQALGKGEIAVAYNPLGSYAHNWAKEYPNIRVVHPTDYTTIVTRSAFIPKGAADVDGATRFLDYLLSKEGQTVLANHSSLYPIRQDVTTERYYRGLRYPAGSSPRPINFGIPLLVQTDRATRRLVLEEWNRALGH